MFSKWSILALTIMVGAMFLVPAGLAQAETDYYYWYGHIDPVDSQSYNKARTAKKAHYKKANYKKVRKVKKSYKKQPARVYKGDSIYDMPGYRPHHSRLDFVHGRLIETQRGYYDGNGMYVFENLEAPAHVEYPAIRRGFYDLYSGTPVRYPAPYPVVPVRQ